MADGVAAGARRGRGRQRFWIKVHKLAEELGSVSEACRLNGVSRAAFYVWKRKMSAPPAAPSPREPVAAVPVSTQPQRLTPLEQVIADLAVEKPSWGPKQLSRHLRQIGLKSSVEVVRTTLVKLKLGSRYVRSLVARKQVSTQPEVKGEK